MKHKILIVDDEEEIRFLVRDFFESERYEVIEAADADALRELFKGSPPDVVLLDLKLPDANGLTLLPEVKKTWPDSRIIILTGYGTPEAAKTAFKLDDLFLQNKPFDLGMLRTLVEMALQQKAKLGTDIAAAKAAN